MTGDPAAIQMQAADLVTEAVEETCRHHHPQENPVTAAMAATEVEAMDQVIARVERRLWEVEGVMAMVGHLENQDHPGLADLVVVTMT